MKIVLHWIILSLATMAIAYFVPHIGLSHFYIAFIVGACLTFINLIIKPIIKVLTLPINLLTFGLFSLVLNGLILYILSMFVTGFSVGTFQAAVIGAFIISVINWIGNKLILKD